MASSVDQRTNRERTLEIFRLKADTGGNEALLAALDDGVRWTIPGSCSASRTYEGKADLVEGILAPLGRRLEGAVRSRVHEVLEAGDTIIVRWRGEGRTLWGEAYENEYCWHDFNQVGLIGHHLVNVLVGRWNFVHNATVLAALDAHRLLG